MLAAIPHNDTLTNTRTKRQSPVIQHKCGKREGCGKRSESTKTSAVGHSYDAEFIPPPIKLPDCSKDKALSDLFRAIFEIGDWRLAKACGERYERMKAN